MPFVAQVSDVIPCAFCLNFILILYREVKNTTCLELVKPSNQQLRLSCDNTSTYHCLLDQNYTTEFETCMMWKWIPQGNCCQCFIQPNVGLLFY